MITLIDIVIVKIGLLIQIDRIMYDLSNEDILIKVKSKL